MEAQYPLNTPYAELDLDKPCFIGELPTKNHKRPIRQYLDIANENNYAGAFLWSMKGPDESSDLVSVMPEVSAWAKDHSPHHTKPAPSTTSK
jgi:hypothetical protein